MNELYNKTTLVPIKRLTRDIMKSIKIGENFFDLARLGLVGEYTEVPATDLCPRLYYRWNYKEGKWEVYATEHDLLGYSQYAVSEIQEELGDDQELLEDLDDRVTKLENSTRPPHPPHPPRPPKPDPDCPCEPDHGPHHPKPDPDCPCEPDNKPHRPDPDCPCPPNPDLKVEYKYSLISRDPKRIGGSNLECLVQGGMLLLSGDIKYYDNEQVDGISLIGNYVGAMITAHREMWHRYKNTVKVQFEGQEFGKDLFDRSGHLILYIKVSELGQESPISLVWNNEFREDYVVAITQESKLLNR